MSSERPKLTPEQHRPMPERPQRLFIPKTESIEIAGKEGVSFELERYKGRGGHGAIGGHFGKEFQHEDLWNAIYDAGHVLPEGKMPPGTGFDRLYRWPTGTSLEDQITYTEAVAQHALTALLEQNDMQPEDIDVLMLASGVPVSDKRTEPRGKFVDIVAEDGGLTRADRFEANLACNSWAYLVNKSLSDPEYMGKNVAILAVEPTASLTPDFDPQRADLFSTLAFSNTVSGVVLQPWIDSAKYESSYLEQRDPTNLRAKMMYEDVIDLNSPRLVQEKDGRVMMRGADPDEGYSLQMAPVGTTKQFIKIGSEFIGNLVTAHRNRYPLETMKTIYGEDYREGDPAYHYASAGVTEGISRNLGRRYGQEMQFPQVISEGNGSAAQSGLVFARTLENRQPTETFLLVAFGAGTSSSGVYMQLMPRR